MTTELMDAPASAIAAYSPFYAQLAELETNNTALVFDYESKKGNKEARSHVNTLRLTKGALERVRKEEKAESLKIGRAIDSEAKEIEARIEAMITVHQVRLDEIERREEERVAVIEACIDSLRRHGESATTAENLAAEISVLEVVVIGDDYAGLKAMALEVKDARLRELRINHAALVKSEAEAAELARLRADSEARAQADRDAAIAAAAVEQARIAEEQRATAAANAARQAIADAEANAKQEREAGERRELELKLQAEQSERRRVEQEQAAALAATQAAERAERERLQAIQNEKDRVAGIAKAEADAQAKREANKAHKAKVNNAALSALVAGGISEECAKQCIVLIASGNVPAVSISY